MPRVTLALLVVIALFISGCRVQHCYQGMISDTSFGEIWTPTPICESLPQSLPQ